MSRNEIMVSATPEQVFDVLDDAYAYPKWVVGTRRVRAVDADWPAVGSRFHHAVGTAAGELHDSSKVVDRRRPDFVELQVRFRPTGVARVRIAVHAEAGASRVVLDEEMESGPLSHLPRLVTDSLLHARNSLSLQRLRHEVERRSEAPATTGSREA
jgi:uncharacterized protein YndB with AHSA1/START domain